MKEFIVCGSGGSTYDNEVNEFENLQVLLHIWGNSFDDAIERLKKNPGYLLIGLASFDSICVYEIAGKMHCPDLKCGRFCEDGKWRINVCDEIRAYNEGFYDMKDYICGLKILLDKIRSDREKGFGGAFLEISLKGLDGKAKADFESSFGALVEGGISKELYSISE